MTSVMIILILSIADDPLNVRDQSMPNNRFTRNLLQSTVALKGFCDCFFFFLRNEANCVRFLMRLQHETAFGK